MKHISSSKKRFDHNCRTPNKDRVKPSYFDAEKHEKPHCDGVFIGSTGLVRYRLEKESGGVIQRTIIDPGNTDPQAMSEFTRDDVRKTRTNSKRKPGCRRFSKKRKEQLLRKQREGLKAKRAREEAEFGWK